QGASQAAHAVLAARGEWITNEKTLLSRAGLTEVNDIVARADNDSLGDTVAAVRDLCARTLDAARTASALPTAGNRGVAPSRRQRSAGAARRLIPDGNR